MDVTGPQLNKVRYQLRFGPEEDVDFYERAEMFDEIQPSLQEELMIDFVMTYSTDMIRHILHRHIKLNNQIQSVRYLELLIARYSLEKSMLSNQEQLRKKTTQLYEMIGYVSVSLWNYQAILGVLNTMKSNNIPITPKFYVILMASLRKKKQHEAGLMLIRQIPQLFPHPSNKFIKFSTNELIRFIRERFPTDGKVVLAHLLAVYPKASSLLNQLGIPGLLYRKTVCQIETFEGEVAIANLDKYFQRPNLQPPRYTINEMYASLFAHMSHHDLNTPENYMMLFKRYISSIKRGLINSNEVDSAVVEQFICNAITKVRKPSMALFMLREFLKLGEPRNFNKQLITLIFYHHGCRAGSKEFDEFTSLMAKFEVVPDFKLMASLAVKDSYQGEMWYSRMKEMGYVIKDDRVKRKAIAKGWDTEESFDVGTESYKDVQVGDAEWDSDVGDAWEDDVDGEFTDRLQQALKSMEVSGQKRQ